MGIWQLNPARRRMEITDGAGRVLAVRAGPGSDLSDLPNQTPVYEFDDDDASAVAFLSGDASQRQAAVDRTRALNQALGQALQQQSTGQPITAGGGGTSGGTSGILGTSQQLNALADIAQTAANAADSAQKLALREEKIRKAAERVGYKLPELEPMAAGARITDEATLSEIASRSPEYAAYFNRLGGIAATAAANARGNALDRWEQEIANYAAWDEASAAAEERGWSTIPALRDAQKQAELEVDRRVQRQIRNLSLKPRTFEGQIDDIVQSGEEEKETLRAATQAKIDVIDRQAARYAKMWERNPKWAQWEAERNLARYKADPDYLKGREWKLQRDRELMLERNGGPPATLRGNDPYVTPRFASGGAIEGDFSYSSPSTPSAPSAASVPASGASFDARYGSSPSSFLSRDTPLGMQTNQALADIEHKRGDELETISRQDQLQRQKLGYQTQNQIDEINTQQALQEQQARRSMATGLEGVQQETTLSQRQVAGRQRLAEERQQEERRLKLEQARVDLGLLAAETRRTLEGIVLEQQRAQALFQERLQRMAVEAQGVEQNLAQSRAAIEQQFQEAVQRLSTQHAGQREDERALVAENPFAARYLQLTPPRLTAVG